MDEYLQRMRSLVNQGQRGGFSPRPPPGAGLGLAAIVLLGGAAVLVQNSLFNVDGGHRAIKYKRTSGVSKEIYSEGLSRRDPAEAGGCLSCPLHIVDAIPVD